MSDTKYLLIFTLHNERFAVDATAVKEIIYLPELTPEEEVPAYIAGIFNFRGHIVPVTDLNIQFGHAPERYRISDKVIIIECEMRSADLEKSKIKNQKSKILVCGIIVNDVHDVISVSESDIEQLSAVSYQPSAHLIKGEVKFGEEIIMLLDHTVIVEFGLRNAELKHQEITMHSEFKDPIFHERAVALAHPPEILAPEGQVPLAVLRLNQELYGIDLNVVKEFSDIYDVTAVPCTPEHIVGNINLRGEILTLIDIRGMLNITPKKGEQGAKAVVANVNDLVAGVAVEDVLDVININPSEIRHVPAAVEAVSHEYIKGEFPYQGRMLSILDMKKILTSKEMVVREEA